MSILALIWNRASLFVIVLCSCSKTRVRSLIASITHKQFYVAHNFYIQSTQRGFYKALKYHSVSTAVRHHDACCRDNIFKVFSAVPNLFKYHHNACFREIVFIFSAIPNCFKYRHDAQFTTLGFTFSAVLTRFKSRHNACLSYIPFIFFSAVPNCFKYRPSAYF